MEAPKGIAVDEVTSWLTERVPDCTPPLDFSPRAAQVRLDGQQFTLHRAREARGARYTSARDGITLTLVRSQATLSRKGQPILNCTLAKQTTP